MSTQKQRELWLSYVYNNRIYLQQDINQLQDNLRCRTVGVVDCLELALALERLNAFNTFVSHTEAIFGLVTADELARYKDIKKH